jgi:uncharacterized protein
MKFIVIAGLLLAAAPVAAQDEAPSRGPATIIVQGRGVAESPPDSFFIGGQLRGQGADRVAALQALSDNQTRVSDGLQSLDGLTGARMRTESVSVEPTYAPNCRAEGRDRDGAGCAIAGYAASIRFQFKGAPASSAGNAVSLAAELGAQNVSTTGTHLEDDQALRAEASRLAFVDAERQANALAEASGRRIIRILRVQDAQARVGDYQGGVVDDIVVTGSRIRPTVAIPVDQPPVRIETRLNVAFEIE